MAASALALQSRFPTRREALPPAENRRLHSWILSRCESAPSGPSDLSSGLAYGVLVSRPRQRGREVRHAVRRKASNCKFGAPGDFFAFSARTDGQHFIEAIIDDTRIACYPCARVEMVADANPEVARALHEVALAAAARAERQILILGQMTAEEKVAAFLLSMVERLSGDGKDEVTLPVSRYEIERAWCTPFPAKRFC